MGLQSIKDEYEARTGRSRELHTRFRRQFPGGETRSVTHYEPYPVVIAEGRGAVVSDVDGNEYLDALNNYTVLVHGHAFPPMVEAVEAALPMGTVFPAPHLHQLAFAELLTTRYPVLERVRFTNSGTEAAMLALRIARAVTGRRRLLMFEGGYHGTAPEFTDADPMVVRVTYNDMESVQAQLDDSVAAVFAEPFLGNAGVIPAENEFLQEVQAAARRVGAMFVLDEVQSLRNSEHGAADMLSLQPDMVIMGKIIGGGFPVGAVGGRAEVLDITAADRVQSLPHSGSFNGNVITTAAGEVCLDALTQDAIDGLDRKARTLRTRIENGAERAGVPIAVTRAGSILHVHVGEGVPRTSAEAASVPTAWSASLHLALLLEGVYAAPRGMLNLSTALDDIQLDRVETAYEQAFLRIQEVVQQTAAPLH